MGKTIKQLADELDMHTLDVLLLADRIHVRNIRYKTNAFLSSKEEQTIRQNVDQQRDEQSDANVQ